MHACMYVRMHVCVMCMCICVPTSVHGVVDACYGLVNPLVAVRECGHWRSDFQSHLLGENKWDLRYLPPAEKQSAFQ